MVTVASLHIYPVKSLGGIALERAEVAKRGLRGDRELLVVDPDGRFLTQRELPRMALIGVAADAGRLVLTAPGVPALEVRREQAAPEGRPVRVWRDEVRARSLGAAPAEWLSRFLAAPCELVWFPDDERRPVSPVEAPEGAEVGFADGYPLLLCSTASRDEVGRRGAPVPMDRFRPNLVVVGAAPFAEDEWAAVRVGGVRFRLVKPCARCSVTTVDQRTGVRGREPLATLATFRTRGGEVHFGWNLVHEGAGWIAVGDEVTIEAR